MRIGFVGGNGHHYLRHVKLDPADGSPVVRAWCGDGHDDARAGAFGQSLAGATACTSLDELLTRFRPDVLSVGAVYGFNGDVIARALKHGVSVVSDKPVAATWEQLATIRRLVDGTGLRVITEFPLRAQREFVAARQAIADGKVGKVALVTVQKSYRFGTRPAWYADRASYGGTLLWVLSHAIDLVPFVTGQTVTRVTGTGGNVTRPDFGSMEDHVTVTMQLSGGATAVLHADYLRPAAAPTHADDRLRVAGAEGVLEIRAERCARMTHEQPETDVTESVPPPRPTGEQVLDAALGLASPNFSTEHTLRTADLLLKCRDAADTRTWVDV